MLAQSDMRPTYVLHGVHELLPAVPNGAATQP
jgi:hypothetical protein